MDTIHYLTQIAELLQHHNLTIATAESCTTGLLAHTLTTLPGSSQYFDTGVITYSNYSKQHLLKIPQTLLTTYGAVSSEVAKAMAQAIQKISNVDIGISTTGIAGPGGATKEKPIGLVYIAIATKKTIHVHQYHFDKNRKENQTQTCQHALQLLLQILQNW